MRKVYFCVCLSCLNHRLHGLIGLRRGWVQDLEGSGIGIPPTEELMLKLMPIVKKVYTLPSITTWKKAINQIEYSPVGKLLAVANYAGLWFYDAETNKKLALLGSVKLNLSL